jgi:hypothetical protein
MASYGFQPAKMAANIANIANIANFLRTPPLATLHVGNC